MRETQNPKRAPGSELPAHSREMSVKFEVKESGPWGAWVAQLVEQPTSAQVMISRFTGSSPASGSVLTAQSLEPASDSVSPSLSSPPQLVLGLSHSLAKINKKTCNTNPGVSHERPVQGKVYLWRSAGRVLYHSWACI